MKLLTGDVVCSMIKTSRTKLITTFGVIAADGVVVNGLTMLADGQDIFTVLNASKCETILTSWKRPEFIFLQKFLKMGKSFPSSDLETVVPVECEQAPCLKQLIVYELSSHEDHTALLSSLEGEDFYQAHGSADDEAHIFLTSGSTSYSKMVLRTHRECLKFADTLDFNSDVFLNNREMEWMAAFPCAYLGSGATTIVQEYTDSSVKISLPDIWNIACDMGATGAMLIPEEMMVVKQGFNRVTVWFNGRAYEGLKFESWVRVCRTSLSLQIPDGYLPYIPADHTIPFDMLKDCYVGDRLLGSVQMKIVDEQTNREVTGPNQVGKLFLKGGMVLRHYMNADSTASGVITDDGWFDSSDVGYIDDVGGIHVIGRTSDTIISGPGVVYPQWLEERIQKYPGVASVAVVGTGFKLFLQM
ncbi:uncharacterized protein LOC131949105 [Physella acuta]|uniref:uncharacterized protein LOC131949105 n=1 Tax=Physella acuta TaxID=109671 RepID=UPI0027DB8DB1|nr:uncharacterized protein LOC131949105 [Physella acuta]